MKFRPRALHVQDVVGGDAVEPGSELTVALKCAESCDGFDQNFLGDFFRVLRLKDHADGDVVHPRLVTQDQLLERGTVAALAFSTSSISVGPLADCSLKGLNTRPRFAK
nr:hypothetical protein [Gemmata palustris]